MDEWDEILAQMPREKTIKGKEATDIDVEFPEIEIPPHAQRAVHAVAPPEVALFKGKRFCPRESERGATSIVLIGVGQQLQIPIATSHNEDIHSVKTQFFSTEAVAETNEIWWSMWQARTKVPLFVVVRNDTDKPVRWSAKASGLWVRS